MMDAPKNNVVALFPTTMTDGDEEDDDTHLLQPVRKSPCCHSCPHPHPLLKFNTTSAL